MNHKGRGWGIVLLIALVSLSVQAAVLYPLEVHTCAGVEADGLCWLEDARLGTYAEWTFEGVPRTARLILEISAHGRELCHYDMGRDVAISIYLGEPGLPGWRRLDATLRSVDRGASPAAYWLSAEVPFSWRAQGTDGRLTVRIQRALICDPHVGLGDMDVRLGLPGVTTPPDTPVDPFEEDLGLPGLAPPDEPAPPPAPPPAPRVGLCEMPYGGGCWLGLVPGLAREAFSPPPGVERVVLSPSYGPERAPILSPGHYQGSVGTVIRGATHFNDWWRLEARVGQDYVIWFQSQSPDLVFDLYIRDVCGEVQCKTEGRQEVIHCLLPCSSTFAGRYPDYETCVYYIHVRRYRGEGTYHLSIFEVP